MEKLQRNIAQKLLQMADGESLPASQLKSGTITKMVGDGIVHKKTTGRKSVLSIPKPDELEFYLKNNFGINGLREYVGALESSETKKQDLVKLASDSKIKRVRSFKGFNVNCINPIHAKLGGVPMVLEPRPGTFTFVYDFDLFEPDKNASIVGIENPANFRYAEKQKHLFQGITPLFVCRYPQTKDLTRWLEKIPNPYLHFGDFDFEGIDIFYEEFKNRLGKRASFFIPNNIENLIMDHGNINLYDKQQKCNTKNIDDQEIVRLVALLHKYKKCLEQEILIGG